MNERTILVTGAAGFIGSHACEALIHRGWRVVGVDNFDPFYSLQDKRRNVECIQRAGAVELQEMDIVDAGAVEALVGRVRPAAILHLAAMAGVRPSIERPAHYCRVNVEGTANLLAAAAKHAVGKFIFASSSSVYGNANKVPFNEEDAVEHPISPYAATKRSGELLCHTYWHLYKLPCFCLRFFTVYGPRQRPDLAIHKFTRLMAEGKAIPFFGDGSTSRDYTYIDDIIAGVMAAVERCDRYRIYNLGGSNPVSLSKMVGEIENAMGRKALLDRKPAQPGDVERTCADVSRAERELGYAPMVEFSEGVRRFVEWFEGQRAQ